VSSTSSPLRVAFLEIGRGWIAPWLDRMTGTSRPGLQRVRAEDRPSELFKRKCWISFEPVESSIAVLANYIGRTDQMATDYPHSTASSRRAETARAARRCPRGKHQVLAGGASVLRPRLIRRRQAGTTKARQRPGEAR